MLDKKVVIALGFFDSVHKGHQAVIEKTVNEAKLCGGKSVVFTFGKDLRAFLGMENGVVFTSDERKDIYTSLGADFIYYAPVSKNFLNKGKLAFLNFLNKKYDIFSYVCGEDYTFGKDRGDVAYLKEYAKNKGQKVCVINSVSDYGKRISSTDIKEYLQNGEVEKANSLLCSDYFITGKVYEDRKIGQKIGFPTVNIAIPQEKAKLKFAVYSGYVYIGGKRYDAIINYGARPTFNLNETLIEAHIIGFSGNLYGKKLKIYFSSFLRDIVKFDSVDTLVNTLKKDIQKVKND